jgi:hypothetical protein
MMTSRGLAEEQSGEADEQDIFDFVLNEEDEKYMGFEENSTTQISDREDDSMKLFIGQVKFLSRPVRNLNLHTYIFNRFLKK